MMILALFIAPMFAGVFALFAAFALAARMARVSEASYVPDPTAAETAEWIESFDDLDIDAEWIALADAVSPVRSFRVEMAQACARIRDRVETRKRENRAAIVAAIVHWHNREDSTFHGWYRELTRQSDANATLDKLDAIARYRQVVFDPSEVLPLAA